MHDKTRKPGRAPLDAKFVARVLELTCSAPSGAATHWTYPRWTFHFTPTSAAWLNAVEGFFSTITRRKIRRGVFKSAPDLEAKIARYIRHHNKSAEPFVWTKPAKAIFDKLARVPAPSVRVSALALPRYSRHCERSEPRGGPWIASSLRSSQ